MTPITKFAQDYLTIEHINGISVPELINLLEAAKRDSRFSIVEQRTDACLEATYLRLDEDEDDSIPTAEEIAAIEAEEAAAAEAEETAAEEAEEVETKEQDYTEYPFFDDDGNLAPAPGDPGEPIMLTIEYLPKNFKDDSDTEYEVVDLMSDGYNKYHVFDNNDNGLLIDCDKVDYLISILKLL
ncbi:hypothetical protein IKH79_01885 [Candidatus Saccharibacteria bacterium]|nr:hypothetical protein [Candidatus Saccharibacteria bacterium]